MTNRQKEMQRIVLLCDASLPAFGWHIDEWDDGLCVQVAFTSKCVKTEEDKEWKGRKWYLSPHMTKSEIVMTCFKAVMTAVEHETREHFKFNGRHVFGPHINIEVLWAICDLEDTRK